MSDKVEEAVKYAIGNIRIENYLLTDKEREKIEKDLRNSELLKKELVKKNGKIRK